MFNFTEESKSVSRIVYLYSEPVRLVNYDKLSREVSYSKDNSKFVYTCYDYELNCITGVDDLRILLNSLSNEED